MGLKTQVLGPYATAFPNLKQRAILEVKQLGLEWCSYGMPVPKVTTHTQCHGTSPGLLDLHGDIMYAQMRTIVLKTCTIISESEGFITMMITWERRIH